MAKLKISYLGLVILGVSAWAQQPEAKVKAVLGDPFAAKVAAMKAAGNRSAAATAEPADAPKVAVQLAANAKTAPPERDKAVAAKPLPVGRDPFLSPVKAVEGEPEKCHGGKHCLTVAEIQLKGTVVTRDGRRLALVESAQHRSYTLGERDQLFDGVVVRITGDSVSFDESHRDRVGKMETRQVTKRVEAPPV